MKDKPLAECPKCKSLVKRLIGKGSGIIFKGHGFYSTDYKKTKNEKPDICPSPNKDNSTCKSCNMNEGNK
jgi:predicted nucleic acid-binding Zn ribbon protein